MSLNGIMDKIISGWDRAKIQILGLDKAKITIWKKTLLAQGVTSVRFTQVTNIILRHDSEIMRLGFSIGYPLFKLYTQRSSGLA